MEKVGRNDPCPCGSGKKYKQCCLLKKGGSGIKRKLSATWLNATSKPQVNLMERAFGNSISTSETFKPLPPAEQTPEQSDSKPEQE